MKKFPLNYIGYYYLEKNDYQTTRIQNDTSGVLFYKIDLEELDFKRVFVVQYCLNVRPLSNVKEKKANPTAIFMGIKKAKFPHYASQPFSIIKREI